jgi:hypothetical protein
MRVEDRPGFHPGRRYTQNQALCLSVALFSPAVRYDRLDKTYSEIMRHDHPQIRRDRLVSGVPLGFPRDPACVDVHWMFQDAN